MMKDANLKDYRLSTVSDYADPVLLESSLDFPVEEASFGYRFNIW